jgi:putative aldouronate transport system permease protein
VSTATHLWYLPERSRNIAPVIAEPRGYRAFRVVNAILLTGVVVVMLYPFVNVVARSLSQSRYIRAGKVGLWPEGFTLAAYRQAMSFSWFWTGYRNSVLYTVLGTAISMVLTTCYAYVLSKKHLRGRRLLVAAAVITMFFDGGIIPNYVLISHLGLRNTMWAVVLPDSINVFNLLVMKAYFETIPIELEEAAAIDGMSTYRILWSVVLPLSKAVIATMTLFYAAFFWNSWFDALLYLDRQDLFPVTLYLRDLTNGAPPNILAMATIVTALPILLVALFVQRYFVAGLRLGAVKG